MRFSLHPEWRALLRYAWSLRLIAIAALLSGIEVALTIFADDPPIGRLLYALISLVVSVGAFSFRLIAQKEFEK